MMKNKSIKANAILNGIKTFITIVFPLLTYPYATRVLGVDNIGKVSYTNSIVNYFILIAGLGIKTYATREGATLREDENKVSTFCSEVFSINLISMVISYMLLAFVTLISPSLQEYKIIMAIQSLAIIGDTIGLMWVFNIFEDFKYITLRTLVVQIISLLLLFIIVRRKDDYMFYAVAMVMGGFIANCFGFFQARKRVNIRFTFGKHLLKHIVPVFVIFSSTIATTIYVNSDVTLLGIFCGEHTVGLYNVSANVYTVLKSLLAAIVIVALPRLSNYYNNGNEDAYKSLCQKLVDALCIIVSPVIVGIVFAAEEIVLIIGGQEFLEAADSLRILGVSLLFSLLAIYMTNAVLLPQKKEKIVLITTIISAFVNLALNCVILSWMSQNGAAITTLIAEIVCCSIALIYSRWKLSYLPKLKGIHESLLGCILIIITCLICNCLMDLSVLRLVIKILVSVCLYGVSLIITKCEIFLQYFDILSRLTGKLIGKKDKY